MTAIETWSGNPSGKSLHGLEDFLIDTAPSQPDDQGIISVPIEIPLDETPSSEAIGVANDHQASNAASHETADSQHNPTEVESLLKPIDNPTTFIPVTELDELTRAPLVETFTYVEDIESEVISLTAQYDGREKRIKDSIERLQAELDATEAERATELSLLHRKKEALLQIADLAVSARARVQAGAHELTESLGSYLTPAINSIQEAQEERDRTQELLTSAEKNLVTRRTDKSRIENALTTARNQLEIVQTASEADIKAYGYNNPYGEQVEEHEMMRPETWNRLCTLRQQVSSLQELQRQVNVAIVSLEREIPNLIAVLRANEVALKRAYTHAKPLYERATEIFQQPEQEASAMLETVAESLRDFHKVNWREGGILEIKHPEETIEATSQPFALVRPTQMIQPAPSRMDLKSIQTTWASRGRPSRSNS